LLKPACEINFFYPLLLYRDGLDEHFFARSDYSPISTADAFDLVRPVRWIKAESTQRGWFGVGDSAHRLDFIARIR